MIKRWLSFAILLGILLLPWHVWGQNTHFILLGWNAYVQGTDTSIGFNVYRASVAGGPYLKLNSTPLPISAVTYSDTTGVGGVKYFYVVSAVDAAGFETQSVEVSATALSSPLAPGGVSATAH